MKGFALGVGLLVCGSAVHALPLASVQIGFSGGRVSVLTVDAPVSAVLTAWAREGHTEVIGAEYVAARRITINLNNVAEADALAAIVGSPSWYTTVSRQPAASESALGRIVILPDAAKAVAADAGDVPERRYVYSDLPSTTSDPLTAAQPAGTAMRQQIVNPGVEPEAIYAYTPTPQGGDIVASPNVVNLNAGLVLPDPETRFSYPMPETVPPPPDYAAAPAAEAFALPDLYFIEGWAGLDLPEVR
jgi:hypothetical protein